MGVKTVKIMQIFPTSDLKNLDSKKPVNRCVIRVYGLINLAGAEGLEPSARGFGDRCSTN